MNSVSSVASCERSGSAKMGQGSIVEIFVLALSFKIRWNAQSPRPFLHEEEALPDGPEGLGGSFIIRGEGAAEIGLHSDSGTGVSEVSGKETPPDLRG